MEYMGYTIPHVMRYNTIEKQKLNNLIKSEVKLFILQFLNKILINDNIYETNFSRTNVININICDNKNIIGNIKLNFGSRSLNQICENDYINCIDTSCVLQKNSCKFINKIKTLIDNDIIIEEPLIDFECVEISKVHRTIMISNYLF